MFPTLLLLVLVGLLIVPLVRLPGVRDVFGYLNELLLTPNLLFFIFLPILFLSLHSI